MPNYKQMYLTMMRATEKAISILLAAQRECEELYLADERAGAPPKIVPLSEVSCFPSEEE